MSSSVDSDGCDRAAPDIFGFAVEARHRGALDPWWRGSCVQGAHPCDGLRTVVRHYGDPKLLRAADLEAIVEDFDRCLATPPVELCEDDFADERLGLQRAG